MKPKKCPECGKNLEREEDGDWCRHCGFVFIKKQKPYVSPYLKYKNLSPRCTYPWRPSAGGYCWSFAYHVDRQEKFRDILSCCKGCECYKK